MFNPPDSETFKKVSEILKKVDTLVKSRDFDRARAEALHAKELDPRNMYAYAYCERIEFLIAQRQREGELEEVIRAEKAKQTEEAIARSKQESELKRREDESRPSRDKEIAAYSKALLDEWKDGLPSTRGVSHLTTLRQSLRITPQEHSEMELTVRREYYSQEFRKLWLSEKEIDDGPDTIKALRKRWCINGGESESIEFEILNQLRCPPARPIVLFVDDDEDLLAITSVVLKDSGFDVCSFSTSDDAYDFLLHSTPDIILADINLETSSMGGFAFFEKIQQLPRVACIPFIFISGLTDEIVIRAGKELGVDDYLIKPFDNDQLLSVIRGKLRRYNELHTVSIT